jgi:alpha-2-macroglobulin
VVVRDARTKDLVSKVLIKVIGTNNPTFFSGQTDLRGVFVAEGVSGQVTAIARKEAGQYAFYRGKSQMGTSPATPASPMSGGRPAAEKRDDSQSLDNNLKMLNESNQIRQLDRLQNRYQEKPQGVNPF